jgi:hypothetical protein
MITVPKIADKIWQKIRQGDRSQKRRRQNFIISRNSAKKHSQLTKRERQRQENNGKIQFLR